MNEKIKIYELLDDLSDVEWAREYFDFEQEIDFIDDIIRPESERKVDIYNDDLRDWAYDNEYAIDEYVEEYGYSDFYKNIQGAQYMKHEEELLRQLDDIKLSYAYAYLKRKGIEEIDDEQINEIENFTTNTDNSSDIEKFCKENIIKESNVNIKTKKQ